MKVTAAAKVSWRAMFAAELSSARRPRALIIAALVVGVAVAGVQGTGHGASLAMALPLTGLVWLVVTLVASRPGVDRLRYSGLLTFDDEGLTVARIGGVDRYGWAWVLAVTQTPGGFVLQCEPRRGQLRLELPRLAVSDEPTLLALFERAGKTPR